MALINTTTTGILGTTVYGDGQGALTVQKDGVTQAIITNAPAFSVYPSTNQTITSSTYTAMAFQNKDFDATNSFDTSTYRFTPTVAGYYYFNIHLVHATTTTRAIIVVYKNGAQERMLNDNQAPNGGSTIGNGCLIYLNGTTDYVHPVACLAGTTPGIYAASWNSTRFYGHLVRAV